VNAPDQASADQRGSPRRLAEYVSLGISIALLLGIAGYLVRQALRSDEPFIACRAELLVEETRKEADRFILPLRVSNPSNRSLRLIRVAIDYTDAAGQPVTRDIDIDYLGERSHQVVYLYVRDDPRKLRITATPAYYLMD
jgi:uncharacterized protein (TIGR02588 family)